jgi:E3 SUMO-protein ligase NSE2
VEEIDDDDGDIEIDRERISLKCPLTLLPFQDPVTSTRCPHSFERQAIEDMIRRSPTTMPLPSSAQQQGTVSRWGGASTGGGKRIKYVGCPVCSVKLTLIDLQPDSILLRRMRRAEVTLMDRDADDQLDPEGARRRRVKGGRQSGFTVASGGGSGEDGDEIVDDEDEEDSHTVSVKRESRPRSRVDMIRHL